MVISWERMLDVLFPVDCAGCQSPGSLVCPRCVGLLSGPARAAWPTPSPPGMPTPWAVASYEGECRALILAFKERGAVGLRRLLSATLATSAKAAVGASAHAGPIVLVPVPSSRRAVRERGDDVMLAIARRAAATLRRDGLDVRTVAALGHCRLVADSAGLSAPQRQANLAGAFAVRPGVCGRLAGSLVLIVDDVITTGASMAEAARALRDCDAQVIGAAAIAATLRTGKRGVGGTALLGADRDGATVGTEPVAPR